MDVPFFFIADVFFPTNSNETQFSLDVIIRLRKFIPYTDLNLPPSIYVISSTLFWFAQAHATFYIYLEKSSSSSRNSYDFMSHFKIPILAWYDILVKKCGMACAHSERGQRSCTNKGKCFAIHRQSSLREQHKSNKSIPSTRVLFIWQWQPS